MKKPKVLKKLSDLPRRCWTEKENESRGCQYCARIRFGPVVLDVMFDSGAGLNTIPEAALLSIINACEVAGIRMSDDRHPVIELESWANEESCKGVASGASVPLIGAVILAMTLVDRNNGKTKTISARFKILKSGTTDWVPTILGGMAIDSTDRGGLGIVPQKNSFYVTALGMSIDRSERFTRGRRGRPTDAKKIEELVFANRSEVVITEFDSESEAGSDASDASVYMDDPCPQDAAAGLTAARVDRDPGFDRVARNYDDDTLDELVVDVDGVVVLTGGGVWIPVRRLRLTDRGDRAVAV